MRVTHYDLWKAMQENMIHGQRAFETVLSSRIDDTVALLDVVSNADRRELVQATDLTNAIRFYDHNYFAALQRWTAPFEASEGIPYDSLA
jgi:pantothenate kinase